MTKEKEALLEVLSLLCEKQSELAVRVDLLQKMVGHLLQIQGVSKDLCVEIKNCSQETQHLESNIMNELQSIVDALQHEKKIPHEKGFEA